MTGRNTPPLDRAAPLRPQDANGAAKATTPEDGNRSTSRGLLAALAACVADSGAETTPFDMPWNLRAGDKAGRSKFRP
jgi:hypothetical protein